MLGAGPVIVEPVFKLGSVWCHCPALDARAVVFQLHSTEPYGFPRCFPGCCGMEAVKKGVAQRLGFRPFFFRPPEWPYFDVIYVSSFYERLIGRKDSKPKMFEIHITLPSQKNGDY